MSKQCYTNAMTSIIRPFSLINLEESVMYSLIVLQ